MAVAHRTHVDQVVDVLEGARLAAVAVDGDVLAAEGLADEVGHHAAVVGVHEGAVGVEDADHADVQVVRAVVVEHDGLRGALALVVARARTDRIHVPVVVLYVAAGTKHYLSAGARRDRRTPRLCWRAADDSQCHVLNGADLEFPTRSTRRS